MHMFTVKPKPVSKKGFLAPEVDVPLQDQVVTPDQKSLVLECKFSSEFRKLLLLIANSECSLRYFLMLLKFWRVSGRTFRLKGVCEK